MGIHDEKALNRSQFPFLGVANHGASGADNAVDAQAFEVSDTLSVIADALRQVSVDKNQFIRLMNCINRRFSVRMPVRSKKMISTGDFTASRSSSSVRTAAIIGFSSR